jgi:hypothetical protein
VGWEKGRYYTRSRKVGRRVVREYVGFGVVAEQAARRDAKRRRQREAARAAFQAARAELDALDARLDELNELADQLAAAALLAAGYHQHNRGEWRRKRENGHANR